MRISILTGTMAWLFLSAINGQAYPESEIRSYINQLRTGEYVERPDNIFDPAHEQQLLSTINEYEADSSEYVINFLCYAYKKTGLATDNNNIKQLCTRKITGLSRFSPGVCGSALGYLTQFHPSDFEPETLNKLSSYLTDDIIWHKNKLMRLNGYLNPPDAATNINSLLQSGSLSPYDRWVANLALARMGDENAVDYCLNKIRTIPVNEDVVYELVPDLLYTKQRKLINYAVQILYSDGKNCHSANPDSDGAILCGYRVMEMLAPVIVDFPFPVSASGDLDVDHYKQALIDLRKWFTTHNDTYKINTQSY